MAATRDEHPPVSWEDLLAAISPPEATAEENLRHIIEVGASLHQEGYITNEEMEDLIKIALAVAINDEVNAVVTDFFSPGSRGNYRSGFNDRISLI